MGILVQSPAQLSPRGRGLPGGKDVTRSLPTRAQVDPEGRIERRNSLRSHNHEHKREAFREYCLRTGPTAALSNSCMSNNARK
jgi:hypothetical protein